MNIRPSSYLIPVNFDDREKLYVNGLSGAVDLVPSKIASQIGSGDFEGLPKNWIAHLLNRGHLTNSSWVEENDKARAIANSILMIKRKFRGYVLLVTYDCNFRCGYCYENTLKNKGLRDERYIMNEGMAKAAFRAMRELSNDVLSKEPVVLYGGEPLSAKTTEAIKNIVRLGKIEGRRFKAVTNAFELQYHAQLLGLNGIEEIQTTLDGPKRIHDNRRNTKNGHGSYEQIIENIQLALEKETKVVVRINIDRTNIHSLNDLYLDLEQRGFFDNPMFKAYCRTVYQVPQRSNKRLMTELELALFYERAKAEGLPITNHIAFGSHIREKMLGLLRHDRLPKLSPAFCGSSYGMYIFDPLGSIYACWDSVGDERFKVGSIVDGLSISQTNLEMWHQHTSSLMTACQECAYMMLCGGGCSWMAIHGPRSDDGYCDDFPKLFDIYARAVIQSKQFDLSEEIV